MLNNGPLCTRYTLSIVGEGRPACGTVLQHGPKNLEVMLGSLAPAAQSPVGGERELAMGDSSLVFLSLSFSESNKNYF